MQATDNIVIAFVPGTSASELNFDASTRAWPDALELRHIEMPGDRLCSAIAKQTNLPVGDLVDHFVIAYKRPNCYGSLIQYMQQEMGFTSAISSRCKPLKSQTKPLTAPVQKVFYHCPYDWRQTNEDSAAKLGEALAELDSVYTKAGQRYRLYIVGHSMGGLVSRCLLENPASKSAPWYSKAQALITLATPHYGAPLALSAILGEKLVSEELPRYVNYIQSVVNNPAFPSTYELLPPPGHAFIQDASGNVQDIYTAAATSSFMKALVSFGFSVKSMQEATAFFATLTTTSPDKTPIPYYCFVGTERDTLANNAGVAAYTYRPGQSTAAGTFAPALESPSGDGVVPADSARFVFSLNDPRCRTFPSYSHGQMGGSDMENYPDSIHAMLELIGLSVPQVTEPSAP